MARVHRVMDRTCIVCGHNLGPYGRICDKCGSIQRPAAGSGALLPPDKYRPCEVCGEPVPEESQETLCDECIEKERPRPIISFEEEDRYRKAKMVAVAGGSVSVAMMVGVMIAMIFVSGTPGWIIGLLALAGVGVLASGSTLLVASKRSNPPIEYYAPIKPENKPPQQQ